MTAPAQDGIQTIDRYVEHVSTVPAIAGETMRQFLREKCPPAIAARGDGHAPEGRVVLMVHGGFFPSSVVFDCALPGYSWMEQLARAGYDVFALDMTGHGRSALALQADPTNVAPEYRDGLAAPIETTGTPGYPFRLVDSDSESADLDAVVEFIRALRGVERVKLVGWSGGGIRTGTYTLRHPDKVERLVIWASSNYRRDGPDGPPAALPAPGWPTTFQSYGHGEQVRWRAHITCDDQIEDAGIFEAVRRGAAEADPIGAEWGGLRGPARTYWGWTRNGAARLACPVLVMVGENDSLLASNKALFEDIGTPRKAFLGVPCASHFMMWERARHVQRRAALEWLEHGTLEGATTGAFRADGSGRIAARAT